MRSVLLFEEPSQITDVLHMAGHMNEHDATSIARAFTRHLLMVAEMARQGLDGVTVDTNVFMECLHTVGY
jgi:vesicle-fusing ATPase